MAQYISKSVLVAEIEELLRKDKKYSTEYSNGKKYAFKKILSLLDTLKVKEVQEEPAKNWHDAKEPPEMYRKYFARYSDGRINGSWERHDDGFIPWKDVIKEHNITHWCYVEDLLKLKYYDR